MFVIPTLRTVVEQPSVTVLIDGNALSHSRLRQQIMGMMWHIVRNPNVGMLFANDLYFLKSDDFPAQTKANTISVIYRVRPDEIILEAIRIM